MAKLIITEEYLDELIKDWSNAVVGRILKRVETESNISKLKNQIKDVFYENVRDLKVNIKAFNWGVKFNRTSSDKR